MQYDEVASLVKEPPTLLRSFVGRGRKKAPQCAVVSVAEPSAVELLR
jgi:hypothetical protein